MTEVPSWADPCAEFRAARDAADARYAGTAMRRYSEMRVKLASPPLRGDKPVLTYPGRTNPAHPPLGGDGGEPGWGGGRGWDRLRTPEAMASPIRLRSRARKAEQIADILNSALLGTILIVYDKAAALIPEFEPDGVDTYPVEITLATDEVVPQGRFHLFAATRDIPAVDLEASGWRWVPGWKGDPHPEVDEP